MYYRKTTVGNTVAPLREGPPGVKSWVSKIFSLLLRLKICFRSRTPFMTAHHYSNCPGPSFILRPNSYLHFSVSSKSIPQGSYYRGVSILCLRSPFFDRKGSCVIKYWMGFCWWTSTSPAILLQETKTEQGDLVESSESLPQLITPLPGVRLIWSKYSPSYLIYEQRGVGQSAVVK